MLGIKTKKRSGEHIKAMLSKHSMLNREYMIFSSKSFIFLPLTEKPENSLVQALNKEGAEVCDVDFKKNRKVENYRSILQKSIGARYSKIIKSYDILGNIAIIDAEKKDSKKIAEAVIKANARVETVLRKASAVSGVYRIRKLEYVMGKRNYIATYRENNATLKFDTRKTFFSTRLAFERNRIRMLVKNNENVMVMFAGVGPFAIEIAKAHPKTHVVGIEINAYAANNMKENAKLNRTDNVIAEKGDVRKFEGKYENFADRIVMPLPMSTFKFVKSASRIANDKCMVHYYKFSDVDNWKKDGVEKVVAEFAKNKCKAKLKNIRIVRPYSSKEVEVCMDLMISKSVKHR